MAIVNPSGPVGQFRGKIGKFVYSLQPNGTTTVRGAGKQYDPSTPAERTGQKRMKSGHAYVRAVLRNPDLKPLYASEAQKRNMRTCDLVMSDFLTDPVIAGVDATKYNGRAAGWVLIMTGDDFKVDRVRVTIRSAAGSRLEMGFAVPAYGSIAKAWVYTAQHDLTPGQVVTLEVTASDRPGHSTVLSTAHSI